uniref:Uncharacterized protein n=1 Tax=Anguilla anguilla TaxID=7936 RepID=A0A0E9T190_ANGAN
MKDMSESGELTFILIKIPNLFSVEPGLVLGSWVQSTFILNLVHISFSCCLAS